MYATAHGSALALQRRPLPTCMTGATDLPYRFGSQEAASAVGGRHGISSSSSSSSSSDHCDGTNVERGAAPPDAASEQAELDDLLRQAHDHLRALRDIPGEPASDTTGHDQGAPRASDGAPPGFKISTILGIIVTAAGALWLLGVIF